MGQGRLRGGPAPARSAPPAAARCRRSEELGAAEDADPAAAGLAGIATASGPAPRRRRWREAAAGMEAAAGAAAGASGAAAEAEEEEVREAAAESHEAGAPGPVRR